MENQESQNSIAASFDLSPRADAFIRKEIVDGEALIWACQPARIQRSLVILAACSALLFCLLQIPVMLNEPDEAMLTLGIMIFMLVWVAVIFTIVIRLQFKNTWYFVTTERIILLFPMLGVINKTYQYLLGPNSEITLKEKKGGGDLTVRSPDFYRNTRKPGQYIKLVNLAEPEQVQYQIAWAIASKRM